MENTSKQEKPDIRDQIRHTIEHLEHVLPGQAPIKDFVHHNTLHGFQHLEFTEALQKAYEITGAFGYLPTEKYREFYNNGRIQRADLLSTLARDKALQADKVVFECADGNITRADLLLIQLRFPLKSITGCQLSWQIEEMEAYKRFQEDVSQQARQRLLQHSETPESESIGKLWEACLATLGLEHFTLHPEELVDLSPEQAESMLEELEHRGERVQQRMHADARQQLDMLIARSGDDITLRGIIQAVSGHDILDDIRPILIRHMASYLDQGMAAWHSPEREQGFYAAWRSAARHNLAAELDELYDLQDQLESMSEDPLETIVTSLHHLGLPQTKWTAYLQRLALELPGWSGMFLWRHQHPDYEEQAYPVEMLDYLAVRLVLEHVFAQRYCQKIWLTEPSLYGLRGHFRRNPSEFIARYALFNQHLPEYLISLIQNQLNCSDMCNDPGAWDLIAQLLWTWQRSSQGHKHRGYTVFSHAWPLFRLAQHLGLSGDEIAGLDEKQVAEIFKTLELLDKQKTGYIWLLAYERNYREKLYNAITVNQDRGAWSSRNERPVAQVLFCMDDREESIRRHLEELNPQIETFGAAGFFGVVINWRGLDDEKVTPLCPVVAVPAHEIAEVACCNREQKMAHDKRRSLRIRLKDILHQETRRNLLTSTALIASAAPAALVTLAAKTFAPRTLGRLSRNLQEKIDRTVATDININATEPKASPSPEDVQLGFTDTEQADRVETFLRNNGLTDVFSPLVALMGHGSGSQNNPHLAAYDCGACSGRHGGPNGRVFAAMSNRPEVRAILSKRGISIPDDTLFLGAEHNTCDDSILWYDLDKTPAEHQAAIKQLTDDIHLASMRSAHERCRRFMSAPAAPTPEGALKHVQGRMADFSQARPELGHATNAAAIIGRRSISRGAFFDRRLFLISYDPTQDPEGSIIENILLAVGPVGAGINLEYYFSTVDNENYGCGSKITHNVTGIFGVMEGASSDLRTGLPKQMIEIHEAMRLQVVVEAKIDVLSKIYMRQPALQELVGKGWLLFAAKDPYSTDIHVFEPDNGWVLWEGDISELPQGRNSTQVYQGNRQPLDPSLIAKAEGQPHV